MLVAGLSLLAGAVIAASPVTPAPWFEFEDYPMKSFERKQEGVTYFELLVAPDGSVARCTITKSSGHEELDDTTCRLASKRARFSPARDDSGQAMYGVYRSLAIWALPDNTIPRRAVPTWR